MSKFAGRSGLTKATIYSIHHKTQGFIGYCAGKSIVSIRKQYPASKGYEVYVSAKGHK